MASESSAADPASVHETRIPPQNDTLVSFFQWAEKFGCHLHEAVEVVNDETKGLHVRVKPGWNGPLPQGTSIAKCPIVTTFSYLNPMDLMGTQRGGWTKFPTQFLETLEPDAVTAFSLADHYLRGKSTFWAAYIDILPKPGQMTTPQYFEGQDLEWLAGTNLFQAREKRLEVWREMYEKGMGILEGCKFEGREGYTWDLFLWAFTILTSRGFSSKVLKESFAASRWDWGDKQFSVLLPVVDLLNHRPLSKVEWQAGRDAVRLSIFEDLQPGQEVDNNYGPKNNEQLMMGYGFCFRGNICDYRTVTLRAPPGSPLSEAKADHREQFPDSELLKEDKYYVLNVFYPLGSSFDILEGSVFSQDLLDAVSVLSANNRELGYLQFAEDRIYIPRAPYGNSRNILAALSQIVVELISHVVRLKGIASRNGKPQNQKQLLADIYIDSQRKISESAIAIAEWTLYRGRGADWGAEKTEKFLDSHLSLLPPERFDDDTLSRIKSIILSRKSLLPDNGELLGYEDLTTLFSPEVQDLCKQFFAGILKPGVPGGEENPMFTQLAYSVFLCFLIAVDRTTSPKGDEAKLPPRLQKWARFLPQEYPEPPEDVAWVLPDEDAEQFLSQFDEAVLSTRESNPGLFSNMAHLTGPWEGDEWWLLSNWIRWAWMVVEQEGVEVPDDPVKFIAAQGASGAAEVLSMSHYLYIPQMGE
ncbi:hypothetical protein FQN54_000286 [Arachnomyces sp. PD_36]|nr:hypothetical protein FQN54_000286 [Arachnomyces sp. PD_36]